MEEQDPDVVNAAYILCSFKSKETAPKPKPKPKSPPKTKTMMSLPWAAGRRIDNETVPKSPPRMMKKGRSTKRSRSCIGWIAATDAANIVAQKTAEVLAAAQEAKENGGGRSSPDSPLDFLLNSDHDTVKKARREEAESSATTTEEKQKLRTDREEQLKRKKEKRLASFRRCDELGRELLNTSAVPTCAPSDGEGTALPSSSSSSSLQASRGAPLDDQSQGVKFLFDLNLPPPDDR